MFPDEDDLISRLKCCVLFPKYKYKYFMILAAVDWLQLRLRWDL